MPDLFSRYIGIVGSRGYKRLDCVRRLVGQLPDDWSAVIVSGGAYGVDLEAEKAAKVRSIPYMVLPYISGLGKAGGVVRNTRVVDFVHELYAFWDLKSPGTLDVSGKAYRAGKLKSLYGPGGEELEAQSWFDRGKGAGRRV